MELIYILGFVYGCVIGSFLSVVIDRLPNNESIVKGRSYCDHCHKKLTWFELFPILSFLIQKGQCRQCKGKLSWQYPTIELLTGLITFGYIYLNSTNSILSWFTINFSQLILIYSLIVISVIDLKLMIIPDEIIIFLVFVGITQFFINLLVRCPSGILFQEMILPSLISAIVLALFFGLLILITKGNGMGGGDFKLSIILGLFLGYSSFIAIYLAFMLGGFVALILLLMRKTKFGKQIPFGPFLALGTLIVIFFHDQLINLYLTLIS